MSNAIEFINLAKKFKTFQLNNLSFNIPKGYITGFIGPNGAGKTTSIKCLLGMLKSDSGTINIFGQDIKQQNADIKQRIGIVMDQTFYVEHWSLIDVERAVAPFYTNWDKNKYATLLSQFHLDPKKKVKELSRGMKMKLMIATALSHNADLLILDEPTSGLDAVARNELLEILSSFISDSEKSVMFSTHITSDLEKTADYLTFILDGSIVFSDTKDSILEDYVLVKGGNNIAGTVPANKIIGFSQNNFGFEGLAHKKDLSALPQGIISEKSTLDDIIVYFSKGGYSK